MGSVQNTEPVKAKHCNICGKLLDSIDTCCNDFSISHDIGFGSHFDTYAVDLHLCVECFDKLVCICKINPLVRTPHTIDYGDYTADDFRSDAAKELFTGIEYNNVKCHDCPCDEDCSDCFDVMKCEFSEDAAEENLGHEQVIKDWCAKLQKDCFVGVCPDDSKPQPEKNTICKNPEKEKCPLNECAFLNYKTMHKPLYDFLFRDYSWIKIVPEERMNHRRLVHCMEFLDLIGGF